jgi:hypothetical protein
MSIPTTSSRERIARHRAAQRARGLRPVVLWLPDVNDPAYRARLAAECRRLADLTPEEDTLTAEFAELAARRRVALTPDAVRRGAVVLVRLPREGEADRLCPFRPAA